MSYVSGIVFESLTLVPSCARRGVNEYCPSLKVMWWNKWRKVFDTDFVSFTNEAFKTRDEARARSKQLQKTFIYLRSKDPRIAFEELRNQIERE